MENRKTEKSRTDGRNKTYGGKPARKSTRPAGYPKKEDDEQSHYRDGDKPIRKSKPAAKEKGTGSSKHDRHDKYESRDKYERYEKSGRRDKYDKHDKRDKYGKTDRYEGYERHDRYDRRERSGKHDKYDKRHRADRYERYDRPKRTERIDRDAQPEQSDTVRLNKFIANSGICSRREADEYIKTGLVTVNGEIVTELGTKVKPDDDIRFNGQRLKGEKKVYLLMNKPKDYVTTMSDPHAKKCVIDLISPEKCKERVVPVGRLDKATTGVLLFTNDGDLAARLTHPSHMVKKIYHVFLDKNLKKPDFDALIKGITLEDGEIHADSLSYVDDDMSQVGIEIHSGRNRIVRRMFEHLGYKVNKLDRVYFAGLTKKKLRRGAWRFLTEEEITYLKMGNFD